MLTFTEKKKILMMNFGPENILNKSVLEEMVLNEKRVIIFMVTSGHRIEWY